MTRAILWATLVAGTLDILYAALMSWMFGNGAAAMLRTVASGPFPPAIGWGATGSILGLAVHFTLMAIMAAAFVAAARTRSGIPRNHARMPGLMPSFFASGVAE